MRKKVYLYHFFASLVTISTIGCSQEEFQNSFSFTERTQESNKLDNASKQALDFVRSLGIITRSSNDLEEMESAYALTKDVFLPIMRSKDNWEVLPDTVLYVVNLKGDKGYVLVSAIDQIVLAYIEHGKMPEIDSINNPGLTLFLNGVIDDIANPRGRDSLVPVGPIQYPYTIDTLYTPMLTTGWGQDSPYNLFCPTIDGVRCPAGCVAVAVAQCLDSLGYHHTSLLAYDYNTCMHEFENNRPVYIKGARIDTTSNTISQYGHAWVLDGGIVRSIHMKDFWGKSYSRINIQRLVHCNWGEEGYQDGYFHSDILDRNLGVDITRTAYTENLQIYYEIYPDSN